MTLSLCEENRILQSISSVKLFVEMGIYKRSFFILILKVLHMFSYDCRRHDFRKKKVLDVKCVFWFSLQLLSESFLILRKLKRDSIINVHTC
jgi:hypothetical protein